MSRKKYRTVNHQEFQETGQVQHSHRTRIRMVLVYPNLYQIGMSNLGFQTVYNQLNSVSDISCERAFLPDTGKGPGDAVKSIETGRKLQEFQIIAFSVSFENDFLNILKILNKAELPFRSDARKESHPFLIAGGVACFVNPEPISPFFDCFLLGESESLLSDFFSHFDLTQKKDSLLRHLANHVKGVYVPSLYRHTYKTDHTLEAKIPQDGYPELIDVRKEYDLDTFSTVTKVLTPNTTFKNTHLIEVSRGCPHGCRFCSAGYIYRPPRFRSQERITRDMNLGSEQTDRIGLVGAAVSDFPGLTDMCRQFESDSIRISFSSLRANALNDDLLTILKQTGVKTATIAPEAGSLKLRQVINKGLTEEDIIQAVQKIIRFGIPNIKLYFMIGLPEESIQDIDELVTLVKQIKDVFLTESRRNKKIGTISISINPFIPKPATPFQWASMDDKKTIREKTNRIRKGLKGISNLRVSFENLKEAYLNALLSRGDSRLADLLESVFKNNGNWAQSIKEFSLDTHFYVTRQRDKDELFPWDFINHGVKKTFLYQEYQKALKIKSSPPCPLPGRCTLCGVCKKENI